ncbi:MAG: GIY-YIG nuclease family protein [Alphaproteobacteria bacterium]|nr:GIY-YIG nuclease family protein [Alphaproteobacteria bacterium]
MEKLYYAYILASGRNGTLYVGVTSDLPKRIWEHKQNAVPGFTQEYDVKTLVYYEAHATAEAAITREKQMKEWKRAWKIKRIEEMNPLWEDLYDGLCV